eukprot:1155736-Pelagomonas_calceolata.AAC.3
MYTLPVDTSSQVWLGLVPGKKGKEKNKGKKKLRRQGKVSLHQLRKLGHICSKSRESPSPEDERGVNADQMVFWQHAAPGHQCYDECFYSQWHVRRFLRLKYVSLFSGPLLSLSSASYSVAAGPFFKSVNLVQLVSNRPTIPSLVTSFGTIYTIVSFLFTYSVFSRITMTIRITMTTTFWLMGISKHMSGPPMVLNRADFFLRCFSPFSELRILKYWGSSRRMSYQQE